MNMQLEMRLRSLEAKLDQVLLTLQSKGPNISMNQLSEADGSQNNPDQLVGLEEAANMLGISPGHLRNLQWGQRLPYYRIGGAVRFDIAELRRHFSQKPRSRIPNKTKVEGG